MMPNPPDLIFLVTTLDQTDEQLVAQVRAVMEFARGHPCRVVATVHGFDDDPRDLREIPEVRAHLRRLVNFGLIALLVRSTTVRQLGAAPDQADSPLWGAFEVWAHGLGLYSGGRLRMPMAEAMAMLKTFAEDILPAAGEALRRNLERYATTSPPIRDCCCSSAAGRREGKNPSDGRPAGSGTWSPGWRRSGRRSRGVSPAATSKDGHQSGGGGPRDTRARASRHVRPVQIWPCTMDELKAAYRRLVKEAHPDVGGSAAEFRRIDEAYEHVAAEIG